MYDEMRNTINRLPRAWKRAILVAFDFVALFAVLWLSYSLRLNTRFVPSNTQWLLMLMAPITAIPVFIRIGLYRAVIRYLPGQIIWTIIQAMSLATLLWMAVVYLADLTGIVGAPRAVPAIYWVLGIVVVSGSRFAAKRLLISPMSESTAGTPIIIYGAGAAGLQLASALGVHGGRRVVGFVDDDFSLHGQDMSGIRVYSPTQIANLVETHHIKEVVLSMPSIASARRKDIYENLAKLDVTVRALPSITDLASGKYLINQVREIDIDDLLGRSAVPADQELIEKMIGGRVILVSGAGGSIGSELTRLIARASPKKLVLLEANEHALYQIDRELREIGDIDLVPALGSVQNIATLDRVFSEHNIDVIFHAAAHKHVPLVEANVVEGVCNNVFGTRAIADAAFRHGVEQFVLISTDKAVRPSNVMGATKRWAELIVSYYGKKARSEGTGQRFCAVRFGNVLGSNGSVVPLFREQIKNGGPITLTDERMTRYFMSIHEAAELIVQAGALSEGGDVFLLEMGQPIRIRDLAENMVRLAGLSVKNPDNPDGDIAFAATGMRTGEKLAEELFYEPDQARPTAHPKILGAMHSSQERKKLQPALRNLEEAIQVGEAARVRDVLFGFLTKSAATAKGRSSNPKSLKKANESATGEVQASQTSK